MDYILLDGDIAQFLPSFGAATVVVKPGTLQGSGGSTFNGKKVCVAGDEDSVQVQGCMYLSGSFSIPGTGTLKIDRLASNQTAQHTQSGGKKMLLKGTMFQAKFEVQSPAQQPNPGGSPVPDPMNQYMGGQGQFTTMNSKYKGT
jgi:Contractile injection system spike tip protein